MQCDINRAAAKIIELSSSKSDKYEDLNGEKKCLRLIEDAKFSHSPLGKALEKQVKIIKEEGKKFEIIQR